VSFAVLEIFVVELGANRWDFNGREKTSNQRILKAKL
jgi:hypothetical protein